MSIIKFTTSIFIISSSLIATELPDLIKKIRENIASPAKLDQINSLEYVGNFKNSDEDFGSIVLSFQKPHLQRIDICKLNKRITRLIGENIGFLQIKDLDTDQFESTIMPPNAYNYLRTNSIETLFFYKTPPSENIILELGDELDWKGIKAVKVTFKYPNNLVYIRYVDSKTGKILATVLPDGNKLVEEGEYIVDRIRFPRKLYTYNKKDELMSTITFEKIKVNPKFEEDFFRYTSSQ